VLVRFFNPRSDIWAKHFVLGDDEITIVAKSEIGLATLKILALNSNDRLLERETLQEAHRFPSKAAKKRIDAIKSFD
jgi:predicted methyltransferase